MTLAYPDPALADGRVRLRPWRAGDLACVAAAASDPRIVEVTSVPAVFTPETGRAWIRRQHTRIDDGVGLSLAVAGAEEDVALGVVVLMLRPQAGVAGLGYWVIPRARGQGLAGSAVRLLSAWALERGGLARVEAWIEPENAASQRVVTAAGFRREGVLRSFLAFEHRRADAVVYARTAEDDAVSPSGDGVAAR